MPVKREIIEPGTVFGWFTFVKDLPDKCRNRMIQVQCRCGMTKEIQLSHMKSGQIYTCGKIGCKLAFNEYLDRKILDKVSEAKGIKFNHNFVKLNELKEYWDVIESTGNVHDCENGHLLTRQFLTNN